MAEIPTTETAGGRPKEVTYAGYLILLEGIVGLIVGGVEYIIWGNDLSLLGVVLAVIAFWLYTMILKQDYAAWMMAVVFNIIAIFLYLAGDNYPGAILTIFCLVYLVTPGVRVHFEQK
ncbi:hypothetical protein EU545_04650 [Candidatus Thorarchaeota archaeon]|nr:MAG: hypothetical protein EU545_04650 [Candidatus Thorarchaeota archaeon]